MADMMFELKPERWYAWEMLPGYMTQDRQMNPYYSPIWVKRVEPRKSGKNILRLEFFNACYPQGVQGFNLELRVLARRYHFLITAIEGNDERCAVLSEINFPWIEKYCAHLLEWRPLRDAPAEARSDVSAWLDHAFGSC